MACICWHLRSSFFIFYFLCSSRLWRASLSPASCTSGSISSLATSSRDQKLPGHSTFSTTWPTKGRSTWAPSTTQCSERYGHASVPLAGLQKLLQSRHVRIPVAAHWQNRSKKTAPSRAFGKISGITMLHTCLNSFDWSLSFTSTSSTSLCRCMLTVLQVHV